MKSGTCDTIVEALQILRGGLYPDSVFYDYEKRLARIDAAIAAVEAGREAGEWQTLNAEGLLPCPFCGSDAKTKQADHVAFVFCPRDDCGGGPCARAYTMAAAISTWNRRARLPAPQPTWERVPQSLKYDLITHAVQHGELPDGYDIIRRRP